jgi:hypothetical protein
MKKKIIKEIAAFIIGSIGMGFLIHVNWQIGIGVSLVLIGLILNGSPR